jgi:inhibitor of cysteine peptidase
MRTRIYCLSILLLSTLLFSACSNTSELGENTTVVVTPAIKGNSASLKVGDILEIQIPTIPTEGYAWQVQDLDTKILTQQGDPEYVKDTSENSAGGTTILRFKAVGAGKTNIGLIYTNAASAGDLALTMKTFGMSVEVKDAE